MVFRHEAPVAGVGRVVTVVALHPVVVHLKGIFAGFLVVDEDLAVADFEFVALIHLDGTLIDGDVIECQADLLSLLRNPHGTVVISCPVLVAVQRIDL